MAKHKNKPVAERKKVTDIEKALNDDERIELWLSQNWLKCLIAVIVIAIVVIAVLTFFNIKEKNAAEVTRAFASAKAEDLPVLLAKDPNAAGADVARLRLAAHLLDKKDAKGALAQFTEVSISTTAPVEFRIRARLSAAACREILGNAKEAAASYKAIYDDKSVAESIRLEAGYHAARLLMASGNAEQAKNILSEIVTLKTVSPWKNQAEMLLNR